MYPPYAQSSPYDGSNRTMIVCCLFLFVCLLILVALLPQATSTRQYHFPYINACVWPFRHLFVCTCTIEPPLGIPPPLCYFSLSSLSLTEVQQDKIHQGFYSGDQLALKTFVAASSTKCSPVELCLPLMAGAPSLDPSRLHELTHLESLTMCLTHRIAREPVKPP